MSLSTAALLLLLLLLSTLSSANVNQLSCQKSAQQLQRQYVATAEAALRLTPARLAVLNNTQYNASFCSLTFAQHEAGLANVLTCNWMGPVKVHSCPRHCLRLLTGSSTAPVWGRYPYHGNSSICLAALHSGIISSHAGGAVIVERFFPADWSNSSSQSIFPNESWAGSWSNAVQSQPVPEAWRPVPSPLTSYSWTVRSRGVVAGQRQTAPFSPRSGHAHARLLSLSPVGNAQAIHHLIVGGRNASHYFNDVWLLRHHTADTQQWPFPMNGEWTRLADAPFSPRSDVALQSVYTQVVNSLTGSRLSNAPPWRLLFLAGQTSHACNQPLLGQCSDEIWQLDVSLNSSDASSSGGGHQQQQSLHFSWSSQPVGQLPNATCGAMLIHDSRELTNGQQRLLGLAGGQLSYADASCQAAITTVNDAWYSSWSNLTHWRQGRSAPFSPRRSMQEDGGLWLTWDQHIQPGWSNRRGHRLDKSITLAGGVRYLRYELQSDTARITRAELYADAWSCTLPTPEYDSSPLDCDWTHAFPIANLSHPPPSQPSASLPVPVAHAASVDSTAAGDYEWRLRFGGMSSLQAERDWRAETPAAVADSLSSVEWRAQVVNVTMLLQPIQYDGLQPYADSVDASRYRLPLVYELCEDELSDPQSPFNRGSDAVISHTTDGWVDKIQPQLTSIHWQPQQMLHEPDDSSWWLYQAASDVNTTRRLFDFRLGRLGYTVQNAYGVGMLAGGHSGADFSNDWISHGVGFCLWPDDPSYLPLLGPLRPAVSGRYSNRWGGEVFNAFQLEPGGTYAPSNPSMLTMPFWSAGDFSEWKCEAGFHFEPPLEAAEVRLTCMASGLWMDAELSSIRRCVKDRLHCSPPFVDAGYDRCVDPLPVVDGITMLSAAALERQTLPSLPPNGTVAPRELSLMRSRERLLVSGQWLSYPAQVTVDGQLCAFPQLHLSDRFCTGEAGSQRCREFASLLSCWPGWAPLYDPTAAPVIVRVGSRLAVSSSIRSWPFGPAEVYMERPLTATISEPRVESMQSDSCRPSGDRLGVQLVDCRVDEPFNLSLCVSGTSTWPQPFFVTLLGFADFDPAFRFSSFTYALVQSTVQRCDPRMPDFLCGRLVECATVLMPRLPLAAYQVKVTIANGGGSNMQQLADSDIRASFTYGLCAAGSLTNYSAEGESTRCVACPRGFSTLNASNQQACVPCSRGRYAAVSGLPDCLPCPVGTFAAGSETVECERCGLNEWQLSTGAEQCSRCDDGQYKLLPLSISSTPSSNRSNPLLSRPCEPCPYGAVCHPNGALVAEAGRYLLIDQTAGTVSTVECSPQACVDVSEQGWCQQAMVQVLPSAVNGTGPAVSGSSGSSFSSSSVAVQWISATGLGVINCCGLNRRPANSATGYVNALCAECEDGYWELGGRCVACGEVRPGLLTALLLSALLCVYLLHRFSHDWSGSAVLPIVVYFMQMSALFLSPLFSSLWLSIVDVDLEQGLGETCVTGPMSAYHKIALRLLSPAVAMGLLGLLLAEQLMLRQAIKGGCCGDGASGLSMRLLSLYRWLLPSAASSLIQRQDSGISLEGFRLLLDDEDSQLQTARAKAAAAAPLLPHDALDEPLMSPSVLAASGVAEEQRPGQQAVLVSGDSVAAVLRYYKRSVLRIAIFSYNSLTTVCLACLHTRRVGELGQRLWQYPSIDLSSTDYRLLQAVVIVVLVLAVIGGPMALLGYLSCQRRSGERLGVNASSTGILLSCYAPRYWYWSVLVLLRRFVLVAILTFTASAPFLWLSAANMSFLLLHVLAWPYQQARDSYLEMLTLTALTAQTMVLAGLPADNQWPEEAKASLLILATVPVLVVLLAAMPRWYDRMRGCCGRLREQQLHERNGAAG